MKKIINTLLLTFLVFFLITTNLFSAIPHVVDFNKILNQSDAGKKAQTTLQQKVTAVSKKFNKEQEGIKKAEIELISQKKMISNEEYQKKVKALREKVVKSQKSREEAFSQITKKRNAAKKELLEKLNPLLRKYMEEKKIRLVIDRKSVIAGDQALDITEDVLKILNRELKSLNIK